MKQSLSLYIILFFCLTFGPVYGQTLPASSQFNDLPQDIELPSEAQLFKDDPDPVVLSAQIAVRLKKIQHAIPLDYNDHVQKYISYNTHEKRRTHLAKMLGRAKKFFPIFEPILAKYGIPDEMKYLAVVESALNPFALSRAGASGPWQFMYSTALRYELKISKQIDERRDPFLACEAACKYLKEMYNLYGNWQLAIASYNCGAGNVNRAIKKAGGSMNFWDVKPFLPLETQAYVPSFIAVVYAMKYADKYGVEPLSMEWENTQRITIRQKYLLTDLAKILELPKQFIIDENPSLLTTYIPAGFILNLPESRIGWLNQYQDSIYQTIQYPLAEQPTNPTSAISENNNTESIETTLETATTPSNPAIKSNTKNPNTKEEWKSVPTIPNSKNSTATIQSAHLLKEDNNEYKTIAYSVQKGDNLGNIASWFHCNVKDIRRWNAITGNNIHPKDELLIYIHKNDYKKFVRFNYLSKNIKDDLSAKITTQEEKDKVARGEKINENTSFIDKINPVKIIAKKDCFQKHTVKNGETLWSIAQKFDEVSVQDIIKWNNLKKNPVLHKGDVLKIRKIACK